MTRRACIGEPVSWFRIERFVLDELPDAEARAVSDHLERCAVCRACADEARSPRALPALPALAPRVPTVAASTATLPKTGTVIELPRRRRVAIATSAIAVAAAVLIFVRPTEAPRDERPSTDVRIRGGDVALVVVRERGGAIVENPDGFTDSDRFRIAITCPPGSDERVRVHVVQGDEVGLAMAATADFRCGNRTFLEGAFRITGDVDALICASFGELDAALEGAPLAQALREGRGGAICRAVRRER